MSPKLLPLYGPIAIHVYGVCIALGVIVGFYLLLQDKKAQQLITESQLFDILCLALIAGIVGGRVLWAFEVWDTLESITTIFTLWHPGYSILGTLCAVIPSLWFYFFYKKIPVLRFLDRLAVYAPLMQAIARIGCFFTGCCYGVATNVPWAITYTHPDTLAPLQIALHPTQLYSTVLLFILFLFLFFFQNNFQRKGQLAGLYLMGTSCQRFLVDFLRADRTLIHTTLSLHQGIACGIFIIGLLLFYKATYAQRSKY